MSHEHCTCCLRERLTRWSQLQVKRSCHVTSVAVANLGQKHVHLCQTQTRIFVYFLVHNVQIKHHDICSSQPVSIMSKWLVYVPYIIFRNNKVDDSLTGCVCVYTYFILYILVHTLQRNVRRLLLTPEHSGLHQMEMKTTRNKPDNPSR